MRFQYIEKSREPGWMGRPGGAGNQISVRYRTEKVHRNEGSTSQFHLRCAGGIGVQLAAFEYAGRRKELGAVAERGDGLAGLIEVANDVENLGVKPEILRSAA